MAITAIKQNPRVEVVSLDQVRNEINETKVEIKPSLIKRMLKAIGEFFAKVKGFFSSNSEDLPSPVEKNVEIPEFSKEQLENAMPQKKSLPPKPKPNKIEQPESEGLSPDKINLSPLPKVTRDNKKLSEKESNLKGLREKRDGILKNIRVRENLEGIKKNLESSDYSYEKDILLLKEAIKKYPGSSKELKILNSKIQKILARS